ncbi:MAG: competence ComEA-like helix-hairpin-helix protein [Flavobacteriales bacterium]|jgi:competence ComEA-like helix-hairpin-helix protein|tara:strand:- start:6567 stop:7523 length:957 start_codon:yes stop_codon:yes gene_type:complete
MVMPYFFINEKYDFTEFKKELEAKKGISEKRDFQLFNFNPNLISRDSLLLLGLSSKQSFNIVNYRKKVGQFKSEKDFRKIYSIEDSLATVLAPYLTFSNNRSKQKVASISKNRNDSLFNFNPNSVSEYELESLGLSSGQAKTLINFKQKGGKFYKKEDLKKIYSISDELYNKLEPYISIERDENEISIIELNSATKEQLKKIRGIGEKTAERLIVYRTKLGGYSNLNQLDDVYGLDSTIKNNKTTYFIINTEVLSKIRINNVTFKELLYHPYCDYNTTKKIINYREMHGDFISIEQILENNLIKAKQYRKIAPYLTLK